MHGDARQAGADRGDGAPNLGSQVLHGGRAEVYYLVKEVVVQPVSCPFQSTLEQAEVYHHAGDRVRCAAHDDLGTVRMAVDAPARLGVHCLLFLSQSLAARSSGSLANFAVRRTVWARWAASIR